MTRRFLPILLPLLLICVWLGMMAAGTGPVDQALLAWLYSGNQPWFRTVAGLATLAGEWQSLVGIVAAGALWLLLKGRSREALLFALVTLSGRLAILAQKIAVGRMRPDQEEHLVVVRSLSFPSAHTANSMIVFLSFALIAAPPRHRAAAVAAALAGTLIVGLSRPMLGVHWPSDVLGGWAFGAAWVMLLTAKARDRSRPAYSLPVQG